MKLSKVGLVFRQGSHYAQIYLIWVNFAYYDLRTLTGVLAKKRTPERIGPRLFARSLLGRNLSQLSPRAFAMALSHKRQGDSRVSRHPRGRGRVCDPVENRGKVVPSRIGVFQASPSRLSTSPLNHKAVIGTTTRLWAAFRRAS